jgi:fructokinase
MSKAIYRIGIDLGGTKTESIILDPEGIEIDRHRTPTPRSGDADEYNLILDHICAVVARAVGLIPAVTPYTIGMGTPGSLDPQTGLLRNSNTVSLNGRPLQVDIEKRIGRGVVIKNDANCFTLAECRLGAAQGFGTVFGIIMGTGCGGGIYLDGHLLEGRHNLGGEWGHFTMDPQGLECYCGNRGCVETKISGAGVERAYFQRFRHRLPMVEIVDGHRKGDPACSEIFGRFLEDFGRSVGGLLSILDPDAVVIGGGLSNIEELYTQGVDLVKRYAFHPNIDTPILRNKLGDSAGVYGSAMIGG